MPSSHFTIKGLTPEEVIASRNQYGSNALHYKKTNAFLESLWRVVKEPMIILLLLASTIYFISGNINDGIFLVISIFLVAFISLYQDKRSRNALEKLNAFSQPKAKVIRSGIEQIIDSTDLVVGDYIIAEEGTLVAADAEIITSNDFSVNESILTGESFSVYKEASKEDKYIYLGTTVSSGLAIACITAIGNNTKLGKIGKSLENIEEEKTPLEIKIVDFVKKMVIVGAIIFLIVWGINFYRSQDVLNSLLKALTLAMSILPEEIPVAFTTFMALGAWRLMKQGIIVKQMKTVETLGSATVICTDKTGTLTENKMSLAKLFLLSTLKTVNPTEPLTQAEKELLELSMWASEPIPFDPMEKALHQAYETIVDVDQRSHFKLIHEYPLGGKPPMMTHIFKNNNGSQIIAAKGAPEALIQVSHLTPLQTEQIVQHIKILTSEGYRVLGVGKAIFEGSHFPKEQTEFKFQFIGVVAFYDPPKQNIKDVLNEFYKAGIEVKIITGDNAETTKSIAQQIGFRGFEKSITGDALMNLPDHELKQRVIDTAIFCRMYPEAKLRIINALKENNQIVAMTGDGVNDGPALKASHIGIAMGKKGTEIAKQAASLILLDDDLSKMIDAIAMGRKIYSNLKKAIQYIISIHIPIILTVFFPLVLNWIYPTIFYPAHVIFLELIMGPTCSIIYENEPMEKNTMLQQPKPFTTTFFHFKELSISILQGLLITCGTLFIYQYAVKLGYNEAITRTMTFTVLIVANIFLTLINRSFYYSIFTTLKYKNNTVPLIIIITLVLYVLLLCIKPFAVFFKFEILTPSQLWVCIAVGFCAVIWFEFVKLAKRWGAKKV